MSTTFKAACIQMTTARDMAPNIDTIASLTRQARSAGADLVMTPEVSNMIEPDRKAQLAKVRFEATTRCWPPAATWRARPGCGCCWARWP